MKDNKILNYFIVLLTIILIISLSILNLYISIYYNSPNPESIYTIKPYYFLGLIMILIVIQFVCVYKALHIKK